MPFELFFFKRAETNLKQSLSEILTKLQEKKTIDKRTLSSFVNSLDEFGKYMKRGVNLYDKDGHAPHIDFNGLYIDGAEEKCLNLKIRNSTPEIKNFYQFLKKDLLSRLTEELKIGNNDRHLNGISTLFYQYGNKDGSYSWDIFRDNVLYAILSYYKIDDKEWLKKINPRVYKNICTTTCKRDWCDRQIIANIFKSKREEMKSTIGFSAQERKSARQSTTGFSTQEQKSAGKSTTGFSAQERKSAGKSTIGFSAQERKSARQSTTGTPKSSVKELVI